MSSADLTTTSRRLGILLSYECGSPSSDPNPTGEITMFNFVRFQVYATGLSLCDIVFYDLIEVLLRICVFQLMTVDSRING